MGMYSNQSAMIGGRRSETTGGVHCERVALAFHALELALRDRNRDVHAKRSEHQGKTGNCKETPCEACHRATEDSKRVPEFSFSDVAGGRGSTAQSDCRGSSHLSGAHPLAMLWMSSFVQAVKDHPSNLDDAAAAVTEVPRLFEITELRVTS